MFCVLLQYHPRYKTDTVEHLAVDLEFMSDFQLHQLCMVDRVSDFVPFAICCY